MEGKGVGGLLLNIECGEQKKKKCLTYSVKEINMLCKMFVYKSEGWRVEE